MTNKPEIYLEIGASFFRIPTPEANYNITVLGGQETSVTRFVEKIVAKEKKTVPAFKGNALAAVSADLSASETDDFYREVSSEIYRDIGQLAKNLSITIMDIPAEDRLQKRVELEVDGDKIENAKSQLKDIVEMTERAAMQIMDKVEDVQGKTDNVKNLLSALKNHPSFSITEPAAESDDLETECPLAVETKDVQRMITQSLDLLAAMPDTRIGEVKGLLAKAIDALDKLPEKTHGMGLLPGSISMTLEDKREIFKQIEDAFTIASTISSDVSKIAEALSFQDLSGQQIMKIIKLLSDFQIQLIALVVSFGSQLKYKERNKDITVEESKKLAQEEVDSYINKLSGTSEEGGMLDQLTVNKMLEEMGF